MYAPRARRPGLSALVLGLALLAPPAAAAAPSEGYQEVHRVGDDVVVRVDRAGHALVEHTLRYRVVAGRLRGFEVAGLDPAAEDFTSSALESDDGKRVPTIVEPVGQDAAARSVRVTLDDPHGVRRGSYQVVLQYRLDLATPEHLVRRGGLYRLTFRSPPASEGRDGARARVELPVAPTEPQPDGDDAATVLATVQRGAEVDTLDLVRPHVARGEAPVWSLRVDPRALPDVAAARDDLRSRPARPPAPRSRVPDLARGLGLVLLAGAVSALVARKGASLAPRQRFVVGLGRLAPARAPAAGVAHAVGTALLLWGSPSLGCAALAVVAGLTVVRAPSGRAPARGPGRWLPLRAEDAFAPAAGDPLDPSTAPGALALGALVALGLLAPRALGPLSPSAELAPLAPLALAPLWLTGGARGLGGDLGARSARWLAPLARRLGDAARTLRVVPIGRFVRGATRPDEVRLAVVPDGAAPGLVALEVGVGLVETLASVTEAPEIHVRVREGSDASARLVASLGASLRVGPGRRDDERVVRVAVAAPTRKATLARLEQLATLLSDRRAPRRAGEGSPVALDRRARRATLAAAPA